jgi:hypothetical protein
MTAEPPASLPAEYRERRQISLANGVHPEGARAVRVTPEEEAVLAEAIILLRDHPQWAIWLPASGGNWIAIRPASSRPPTPELPTIWVHADTAGELAELMQAADEQVSGRATSITSPARPGA